MGGRKPSGRLAPVSREETLGFGGGPEASRRWQGKERQGTVRVEVN